MNPTLEQFSVIYDFENVLERGLQALFTVLQIKSFTTQDFGATKDDGRGNQIPVIDFQKERPRVEIMFTVGAGQGQFRPLTVDDLEVPVETSFKGRFTLDVITGADIRVHAAYRTAVRGLLHTQLLGINGTDPMTLHRVQAFQLDGGTSPTFKSEEGYLRTILNFDIDFCIQDAAWPTTPVEPDITPIVTNPLVTVDSDNITTLDGDRIVVF